MFSVGSEAGVDFGSFAEPFAWPFIFDGLLGVSWFAAWAACLRVRTPGEPFIVNNWVTVWPRTQ